MEVYESKPLEWQEEPPCKAGQLPPLIGSGSGLSGHCAITIGRSIWILGGKTKDCVSRPAMSFYVWRFNADSSMWTQLTPEDEHDCPDRRWGHSACKVGSEGQVLIVGGFDSSFNKRDVWSLSTRELERTDDFVPGAFRSPPAAGNLDIWGGYHSLVYSRVFQTCILFGGQCCQSGEYDFSGYTYACNLRDDHSERPQTGEKMVDFTAWTRMKTKGQSPSPRAQHCAALWRGDTMLVYGGACAEQTFNDVWGLDLRTTTWTELKPSPRFDVRSSPAVKPLSPRPFRIEQCRPFATVHDDCLLVLGQAWPQASHKLDGGGAPSGGKARHFRLRPHAFHLLRREWLALPNRNLNRTACWKSNFAASTALAPPASATSGNSQKDVFGLAQAISASDIGCNRCVEERDTCRQDEAIWIFGCDCVNQEHHVHTLRLASGPISFIEHLLRRVMHSQDPHCALSRVPSESVEVIIRFLSGHIGDLVCSAYSHNSC